PLDDRNRAAIGYDMFTDPVRRDAMRRAAQTGEPAASGKVILVQEIREDVQAGFLIYVPVYSKEPANANVGEDNLFGYIYAPFRAGDLLHGIFNDDIPRVSYSIYDGTEPEEGALLYESPHDRNYDPLMRDTRQIMVA